MQTSSAVTTNCALQCEDFSKFISDELNVLSSRDSHEDINDESAILDQQISIIESKAKGISDEYRAEIVAFCNMVSHAHGANKVLPLTNPLHAKEITSLTTSESYFTMMWLHDSESCKFIFSNIYNNTLAISANKIEKACMDQLKKSIQESAHFAIPTLWNRGEIIDRNGPSTVDKRLLTAHLMMLNLRKGNVRSHHNFFIKKSRSSKITFTYGAKILSITESSHNGEWKHDITLRDKGNNICEDPFDIKYIVNTMLFVISHIFLLKFSYGTWRLSRESLCRADLMLSDAFVIPSINLISNLHNYNMKDIQKLLIWSFDLPSMEAYDTGYFTISEAVPKLVGKAVSQFPRIGEGFIGIYRHMYGGCDNFMTLYERSFYKTLGEIIYICLYHGFYLDKNFTDFMVKGLLIFHIAELIDSRVIYDRSKRRKICQRLFEVHKYYLFKYAGVNEILHDEVDTFAALDDNSLMKLVEAFFISSDWWKSMKLPKEPNFLKKELISRCWALMQHSLKEAIWKNYDQFIDPMYTIAKSLASKILINDSVGHHSNVSKYKDSLRLLDKTLSDSHFPTLQFLTETNALKSILIEKMPKLLNIHAGENNLVSVKKAKWLKDALQEDNNGEFTYDLWKFLIPTTFEGLKYISVCTTNNIGRMIYYSPCVGTIYVSCMFYTLNHKQNWVPLNSFDLRDEDKLISDFIQSVKDSISWCSGYPELENKAYVDDAM